MSSLIWLAAMNPDWQEAFFRRIGMNLKQLVVAVSLGLALAGSVAAETIVITEPEVRTIVVKEGYADPISVVREGDMWRVRSVRSSAPGEVTVFVDAEGKVLGAADLVRTRITKTTTTTTVTPATPMPAPAPAPAPTPVTEASVEAIVINAGFHNVHDIDMLESKGVWKAEADDIAGEDYELHVDALSGAIVHIEDD